MQHLREGFTSDVKQSLKEYEVEVAKQIE